MYKILSQRKSSSLDRFKFYISIEQYTNFQSLERINQNLIPLRFL